jgi:acetyl esterase/lipase
MPDPTDILTRPAPGGAARIAYGPEPQQFGELRLPPGRGPHPLAIGVHGGFWRARYDLAHFGHVCAALTAAGVATWSVEYRRLGDPGAGWPGTFLDVARAADFVRELAPTHNLDLDRTISIGHSAGGHLAVWLAGRARISAASALHTPDPLPLCAAVSLAGVLDLARAEELGLSENVTRQFLGGSPGEVPERYAAASPIALLPMGVRQLIVSGDADDNVPFEISERYAEAARAAGDPVTLLAFPGTGHFELVDPTSKEWSAMLVAVLQLGA